MISLNLENVISMLLLIFLAFGIWHFAGPYVGIKSPV